MTDAEEIEERQGKRDAYLVAFYGLVKDKSMRWASHHDIAVKADLSDSEAMAIGSLLAERHFVEFRTIGGAAGSVELTSRGVDEAERIIQQRLKQKPAYMPNVEEGSLEADHLWVNKYMPMVKLAFDAFSREGSWPELDSLQRALDRSGAEIDVRNAIVSLPRSPGEMRSAFPIQFYLPLRMLMFLPEAKDVLDVCWELIRKAVETYFSDSDALTITSEDTWFGRSEAEKTYGPVAARLLMSDFPSPIAGGGINSDGIWSLSINGTMARRFKNIRSIDDYFERQRELKRESLEQLSLQSGTSFSNDVPNIEILADSNRVLAQSSYPVESPSIFVVMPFTESWSPGIYDFIRRAIRSLGRSLERVIRADEITAPGKIDAQIINAIQSADLVIGDITNTNPNVMWELGYAEAAGIPIVILNQRVDDSPFDLVTTRQVNYRLAPTEDDETNLAGHIDAALSVGK